jgi:hypothetical protein
LSGDASAGPPGTRERVGIGMFRRSRSQIPVESDPPAAKVLYSALPNQRDAAYTGYISGLEPNEIDTA